MFQSYMSGGYGNQFLVSSRPLQQIPFGRIHDFSLIKQANVLSMLTRMRQLALHPGLVPSTYIKQLQDSDGTQHGSDMATSIQISAQDKSRLQDLLAQVIEDSEECPICFSILTDPRITTCAHAFCLAW
jgi:SWI/SNF-related matrix-associated actin-dependent regulator of chromatin subfamily A3